MRAVAVTCVAIVAGFASLLPTTHAHGYLTAPKVKFRTNYEDPTAYSATIDGTNALPPPSGMHYGWGPTLSTEAFTAAFADSRYKTLRDFVMKHQVLETSKAISQECGRTTTDSSVAQALPDMVVWQHGDGEGFTLSHEGPCEIWCDNERVFVEKNCAKTYPQVPARLPYDKAKCIGKARLQIVWLALHDGTRWQVYMNCAPLIGAHNDTSATIASGSYDQAPVNLPGTVRPAQIPPEATVEIGSRNTTQQPVTVGIGSRNSTQQTVTGLRSNRTATYGGEIFDCSGDAKAYEAEQSRQNIPRRTLYPLPPYLRRPRQLVRDRDHNDAELLRHSYTRPLRKGTHGKTVDEKAIHTEPQGDRPQRSRG